MQPVGKDAVCVVAQQTPCSPTPSSSPSGTHCHKAVQVQVPFAECPRAFVCSYPGSPRHPLLRFLGWRTACNVTVIVLTASESLVSAALRIAHITFLQPQDSSLWQAACQHAAAGAALGFTSGSGSLSTRSSSSGVRVLLKAFCSSSRCFVAVVLSWHGQLSCRTPSSLPWSFWLVVKQHSNNAWTCSIHA